MSYCYNVCIFAQAENRATEAERTVSKLQKEVDRLEGRTPSQSHSLFLYQHAGSTFSETADMLVTVNRLPMRPKVRYTHAGLCSLALPLLHPYFVSRRIMRLCVCVPNRLNSI